MPLMSNVRHPVTHALFDRFESPGTMLEAEQELVSLGEAAVPILATLFSGEARNQFGVPYRKLGLPLRCAIETASRLGRIAKPLEPYLRDEVRKGDHSAAMALRSLGRIEQESVNALAASLLGDFDLSHESAFTLVCCGEAENPEVRKIVESSQKAATLLSRAAFYDKEGNHNEPPMADA
jgi:hypothetical protein